MMSTFLNSFFAVGVQVVILFILIGVGAGCRIFKQLDEQAVKGFTNLLLTAVTTCLLVVSFQRNPTPEQLRIAGTAALIGVILHLISIVLAHTLIHDRDQSRQAILRFSVVFSNAGYMSIPLQEAVLGADGVFCGAMVVGAFQLFVWTYGLWQMSGDVRTLSIQKIVKNPGIIGLVIAMVLFLGSISLPRVVAEPCRHLSNLNTPVAMIVIGYHLAGAKIAGVLRDRKAIFAIILRLFVSPLLLVLVLRILGIKDRTLLIATVIAASAPAAAITTMFAVQYRPKYVDLSVEMVSFSTLLSVVSMPIVVAFADALFQ